MIKTNNKVLGRFQFFFQFYRTKASTATNISDLQIVVICRFRGISMSTYGGRAFGHAGPSTWNALPNTLKCSTHSLSTFRRHLRQFYFSFYQHTERVQGYLKLTRYVN